MQEKRRPAYKRLEVSIETGRQLLSEYLSDVPFAASPLKYGIQGQSLLLFWFRSDGIWLDETYLLSALERSQGLSPYRLLRGRAFEQLSRGKKIAVATELGDD